MHKSIHRALFALVVGVLGTAPGPLMAGAPAAPPATMTQLADAVWDSARSGQGELSFAEAIRKAQLPDEAAVLGVLRSDLDTLEAHFAKREGARGERLAIVAKELDEALAGDGSARMLSKALKSAVEMFLLTPQDQRPAFLHQTRIQTLISRADAAAHQAESQGHWVMASELFLRLNALLEEDGTYKADARRMLDRIQQIRLYVPQRYWEMRNQRRIDEGQKPLPPYNPTGDDFDKKLRDVDGRAVKAALVRAAQQHVERKPLRQLLVGGLESVRHMATTTDLRAAFPGLADAQARDQFVAWVDGRIALYRTARSDPSVFEMDTMVNDLLGASRATVRIPDGAILHELGNGAFDRLDEFSAIIWPDELTRFMRVLEGEFIGVGIQIQLDEETQMVKVVAPIEGTPAFKGGVKKDDLLKKIDDQSAIGMTLDQAVDLITGKIGTKVKLTMERAGEDVDILLTRDRIPLKTVKGWRRTGPRDQDWDWFIDPQNRIGYVRLTEFKEDTTHDLRAALDAMKQQGLAGVILDLRFNPGGLLTQAVSVANTFIDAGTIVSTKDGAGVLTDTQKAYPSAQRIAAVPVAVLINEGSASASEIVAGAMKHYADEGRIRATVIGQRTFGKGSVQNVLTLARNSMLKVTTQYYYLPDDTCIHRREHAKAWGVTPHLAVEMLPQATIDALTLRQDADAPGAWASTPGAGKPVPDPRRLVDDGLDLQLETALFILKSQTVGRQMAAAPPKDGTVTK